MARKSSLSASDHHVSFARPIRASEMRIFVSNKLSLRLYRYASPLLFQRVSSKSLAYFLPPNEFEGLFEDRSCDLKALSSSIPTTTCASLVEFRLTNFFLTNLEKSPKKVMVCMKLIGNTDFIRSQEVSNDSKRLEVTRN
jgi:hypothetical protein